MKKLFFICIFLSGCGIVHNDYVEYSNKICEKNGGLDYIMITFGDIYAECINGVSAEINAIHIQKWKDSTQK